MRVQFIGQQGDPDFVTVFGFNFERKGDPVEVPDDHPKAGKFVNNPYFKVEGAPANLVIPGARKNDPDDVSARSAGNRAAAPTPARAAPPAATAPAPLAPPPPPKA